MDLRNKNILITAGPTYEPIDPVRFIGNRSSGKMGYFIAEKLAEKGAKVFLVSGPTNLNIKNKNIIKTDVETAGEMYEKSMELFPDCDIAILSAAVADFTPTKVEDKKIKKEDKMLLHLKKTKDILFNLGKIKKDNQILVGFSLETDNEIENAKQKLKKKNLDFIVLNSLNDKGAGFSFDTNKITVINKFESIKEYSLKPKDEVADDIINYLIKFEKTS